MEEQMTMLDDIDQDKRMRNRMDEARIKDKLEKDYHMVSSIDEGLDGVVAIVQMTTYGAADGRPRHYYRVVIGYHNTVAGLEMHIISMPNEEWPDVPTWMMDKERGFQWIYAIRNMYTKNEPERIEMKSSW